MSKNKKTAYAVDDMYKAVDLVEKHYDEYVVMALDGKGMFAGVKIKDDDGEVACAMTLCEMITNLMLYSQFEGKKRKNKVGITQGKLDLAYLMCVEILRKLVFAGATDYADIAEQIDNDGDNWVEESDIRKAREDEEEIELEQYARKRECVAKRDVQDCQKIFDAICEKNEEAEGRVVLRDVRDCRDLVEAFCEEFDVSAKKLAKDIFSDDFAGLSLTDRKTGKTIQIEIELSDAQRSELIEYFGLEED